MEPANTEKYTSLSPASVSGGRRHRMKKVSAKTIKKTLKRLGMKPKGRVVIRGGGEMDGETKDEMSAGRRRRRHHTKKTHRRHRRSLFGLKY